MKPFQMRAEQHFSRAWKTSGGFNPSTKDLEQCGVERYALIPRPMKHRSETCATWKWSQGTLQPAFYWFAWHTLLHCQEQKVALPTAGAQRNVVVVYLVVGWLTWPAVLVPNNKVHKACTTWYNDFVMRPNKRLKKVSASAKFSMSKSKQARCQN